MARTVTRAKPASHHAHKASGRGEYQTPAVLDFVTKLVAAEPPALKRLREGTPRQGIPPISIGPDEGRILEALTRLCGARKAVEVGTLAGYSACWIARGLPDDGVLHTVEFDPKHAAAAKENLRAAGLSAKVAVHLGPALEVLPALEGEGPFDLCFIDADKANYERYARWALENVRPGGLVVGDNAYLFGKVHLKPSQAGEDAAGVPGMQGFLKLLCDERYFSARAMIPTGEGLAIAVRA